MNKITGKFFQREVGILSVVTQSRKLKTLSELNVIFAPANYIIWVICLPLERTGVKSLSVWSSALPLRTCGNLLKIVRGYESRPWRFIFQVSNIIGTK